MRRPPASASSCLPAGLTSRRSWLWAPPRASPSTPARQKVRCCYTCTVEGCTCDADPLVFHGFITLTDTVWGTISDIEVKLHQLRQQGWRP